jgi:NADH-quinone oxidoreductase subunit L
MVAAGVYMLARVGFIIQASATALLVIGWIGTITAFMAALIATQQDDIKRILAYSTLSQLGYMVMAIGLASSSAAMFHLFTHAFFKALLFLGAGAVILALHHEQNIWEMGGLARTMKITFATCLIGALALMGVPPLSGFLSKDAILTIAFAHNKSMFALGLAAAFLTAFYMTRWLIVVFFGRSRGHAARGSRESPVVMTAPLVLLAVLVGLSSSRFFNEQFLALPLEDESARTVSMFAIAVFVLGALLAFFIYRGRASEAVRIDILRNKFYVDEFYAWLINWTQELLARIAAFFDRWIIDAGAVRGVSGGTWGFGALLRLIQVGNLQAYAFLFGLGIVGVIYFAVFR